ncbi:hypothetical protein [Nostoc sp.]|uniref:hypothetical protein n=1 Tax=Nostoc sp. TaxID=1180 RepID=UPI002FFB5DAA
MILIPLNQLRSQPRRQMLNRLVPSVELMIMSSATARVGGCVKMLKVIQTRKAKLLVKSAITISACYNLQD